MELLDTERQYCHHLQLTAQVFRLQDTEYLKQKGIDSTTLFGNLLEVISNKNVSTLHRLTTIKKKRRSSNYRSGSSTSWMNAKMENPLPMPSPPPSATVSSGPNRNSAEFTATIAPITTMLRPVSKRWHASTDQLQVKTQSNWQFSWMFQYESMPEVSKVLMDGVLMLREEVVCFNMGSIIIKPVQRILKYPLLLNELVKVTY